MDRSNSNNATTGSSSSYCCCSDSTNKGNSVISSQTKSKLFAAVGILFGTILLLVVSLAWVDFIATIRQKFTVFKNPLWSQAIFTVIITVISLAFLLYFNPFSASIGGDKPSGIERAVK